MAYSIQTATSDGTLNTLDLTFKYMDKSHVHVYVDDILVDGSSYTYTWLTDTRIKLVPTVAQGSVVKLIRKTLTAEMWHIFSQGARFSTTSIDENYTQLLYLAQEYTEGVYVSDFYTDLDLHLHRLLNLGDPINDGDAVNLKTLKEYLPNLDLLVPIADRVTTLEQTTVTTVELGANTGSSGVGTTHGMSVQGVLDGTFVYSTLRAYSGSATRLWLGGRSNIFDNAHGTWVRTHEIAAYTDNDGTYLVDALGRGWTRQYTGDISVLWFGADRVGLDDSYLATQRAIDWASTLGGVVHAPAGQYLWRSMPVMKNGVTLKGDGYYKGDDASREGVTSFLAEHSGAGMLSLKGAIGVGLSNFSLQGSPSIRPKTGLLLGRSSLASAGHHSIRDVSVIGWFTVAAIYSIASEDNVWDNVLTWNFGGEAQYGFVSSPQDIFNIDGLVTSTNLNNSLRGMRIINTNPLASAAGIFLECAEDMGSWNWTDCYITQYAGAYIRINNGEIDGKAAFGPLRFAGVSGEPLAGGNPLVGIDLTAPVDVNLVGLTVTSARFQLAAGADHFDIRQGAHVTLINPHIVIQPPAAFPYATSQVLRNKVKGGFVSVGRQYLWEPCVLMGSWINSFGTPYVQASYRVTPEGTVTLRGTVTGGTGAIWTVPVDLLPEYNMFLSSGGNKLLLNASTGVLSLFSGVGTDIDLSNISWST